MSNHGVSGYTLAEHVVQTTFFQGVSGVERLTGLLKREAERLGDVYVHVSSLLFPATGFRG